MKQRIQTGLYVVLIIVVALGAQIFVNTIRKSNDRITEVFTEAGTSTKAGNIRMTVDYGIKYLTEADKQDLIRFIAAQIGLELEEEMVSIRGKETSHMKIEKSGKNASTTIEIVSLEEPVEERVKEVHQYLLIDLTLHEDIDSILAYRRLLEKLMEELQAEDYRTTLTFRGTYEGMLNMEEKDAITERILKSMEGKPSVELKTEDIYSVYGYTALMEDYTEVQKTKVNINVVMYYNEAENTTELKLATPIVNEDF